MTDQEAYKYFLNLVNKYKTHTIVPEVFNLIYNAALINWVKLKLPANDFVQSRIDDLRELFVSQESPIYPIAGTIKNKFEVPADYFQGVRARFRIQYVDSTCFPNGPSSSLIGPGLWKSDRASAIEASFYTKPKDSRTYFAYQNGIIKLFTGLDSGLSKSYGIEMYLDYYKYPTKVNFVAGQAPQLLQFKDKQSQEIAEKAAQEFLEKNRDPRYQTMLNEQALKQNLN